MTDWTFDPDRPTLAQLRAHLVAPGIICLITNDDPKDEVTVLMCTYGIFYVTYDGDITKLTPDGPGPTYRAPDARPRTPRPPMSGAQ